MPIAMNLDIAKEFFVFGSEITFVYKELSKDFWDKTDMRFEDEEEAERIFDKICSHIESGAKICFVD